MNCSEFQQRLQQAVDAHGPTAEQSAQFQIHLRECDSGECARIWADQQSLASALRQWKLSLPQADLADRVLRELNDPAATAGLAQNGLSRLEAKYALVRVPDEAPRPVTRSSPPSDQRTWWTVGTVIAALVLMALLTLSRPNDSPEVAVERPHRATENLVATVESVPHASSATADRSRRLVDSYAVMPLNATELMTDAVVLVVPADLTDPDAEPSRADAWATRLEKQLEPIGKELSSALDVLLKAVPKSPMKST